SPFIWYSASPCRDTASAWRRICARGATSSMSPDAAIVSMVDVNKWFGDFHVLRDINLTVGRGEKVVICGPSGSGKSTLIRCINRLEEHQEGRIVVDGMELTDKVRDVD